MELSERMFTQTLVWIVKNSTIERVFMRTDVLRTCVHPGSADLTVSHSEPKTKNYSEQSQEERKKTVSNKTNYYEFYATHYLNSDAETRKASKAHWLKVHKENLEKGNNEQINFSAQILAIILMAESESEEK